jgi:hypothetical protein
MKLVPSSQGYMHDIEIAAMVGAATLLSADVDGDVLEIGAYKGRTTSGLVQVAGTTVAVDTFMGGEDLPEHDSFPEFEANLRRLDVTHHRDDEGARIYRSNFNSTLIVYRGDSKEIVPKLTAMLPVPYSGRFRLALVDGSHTVDGASADILNTMEVLSPGGFLFIDDWDWAEVREAIGRTIGKKRQIQQVTSKLCYVVK